jgi:hypothetical protein
LNGVFTSDGKLGPTAPFKIIDGTAVAPGLAFASETGMGWFRPAAKTIGMAEGGVRVGTFDFTVATNTSLYLYPQTVGSSGFGLYANPFGNADKTSVVLSIDPAAGAYLSSLGSDGSAIRKKFNFGASDYAFVCLGGAAATVTFDGNGAIGIPVNSTYSFATSTSYFAKGGIFIDSYGLAGTTIFANAVTSKPGGASCALSFQHDPGVTLQLQMQIGTGAYNFNQGNDAQKFGGATTWTVLSDRRAKHDIEDYEDGLEQVLAIRPRRFKFNSTPDQEHVGIVADEMKKVMPRTITSGPDGFDLYSGDAVLWATVNAVKQLHERLRNLEAVT